MLLQLIHRVRFSFLKIIFFPCDTFHCVEHVCCRENKSAHKESKKIQCFLQKIIYIKKQNVNFPQTFVGAKSSLHPTFDSRQKSPRNPRATTSFDPALQRKQNSFHPMSRLPPERKPSRGSPQLRHLPQSL